MSKSPKRPSIIASFGALSADINAAAPAPAEQPPVSQPAPASRVGAGVIGVAHRAISDIRSERDRLQAMLDSGGSGFVEIDPALVDPSPFPDRLPDDNDTDYRQFRESFASEGQKVPIQVRAHPTAVGRYQVIYGHRRLRAAKDLGLKVRALIFDMSDRDLVVSQGIENASRQDLSWIERALFAARMEAAEIKPRDIKAALSIDDAELAKMRAVYRSVPMDVVEMIGRAPRIGRPRWGEFAKLLTGDQTLKSVRKTLSDAKDQGDSNDRFQLALSALVTVRPDTAEETEVLDGNGVRLGRLRVTPKEFRLMADTARGAAFAAFVQAQLPALMERFETLEQAD